MTDLGPLFEQPRDSVFEGPAPLHRSPNPTEVEAARKTETTVAKLRREVYGHVKAAPDGMAGFEVCDLYPEKPEHAVRPRLTDLLDRGLVYKEGRRKNHRDNGEMIWHAVAEKDWSDEKYERERCDCCGQLVR